VTFRIYQGPTDAKKAALVVSINGATLDAYSLENPNKKHHLAPIANTKES